MVCGIWLYHKVEFNLKTGEKAYCKVAPIQRGTTSPYVPFRHKFPVFIFLKQNIIRFAISSLRLNGFYSGIDNRRYFTKKMESYGNPKKTKEEKNNQELVISQFHMKFRDGTMPSIYRSRSWLMNEIAFDYCYGRIMYKAIENPVCTCYIHGEISIPRARIVLLRGYRCWVGVAGGFGIGRNCWAKQLFLPTNRILLGK